MVNTMTKAEEKKLEKAAERLIKNMKIKDSKGYMHNEIAAYWKYDENFCSLIGSLRAIPERGIFTDQIFSEYNRNDLKEFVKFILKIRKENEIELIFWKEIKK